MAHLFPGTLSEFADLSARWSNSGSVHLSGARRRVSAASRHSHYRFLAGFAFDSNCRCFLPPLASVSSDTTTNLSFSLSLSPPSSPHVVCSWQELEL